tara:strand:+ start:522 stop:926 length:405 start_codon:yes stop_codon:yes gene_type:complete
MKVMTCGTFDLFHIGHLNMIKKCLEYGDELFVGISTDNFNFRKKKRFPIVNQNERLEIIKNIKGVTECFFEESLELKREYIKKFNADIFIIGDDWRGKFDYLNEICQVIYLPRTENISTTEIIDKIQNHFNIKS